jgi:outer membrane immunogenic protein
VGVLQDLYTGAVNPTITPLLGGVQTGPVNQWGVGGTFGGYIGCNYQVGRLVLGVEADSWWSSMKVESNATTLGTVIKASTTNPWTGDVAGRIGVAFGEYLLYTKAGVAFGSFRYNLTSTNNVGVAQSGNAASAGFIGGFGLEYAIMPDVTLRAETNFIYFSNNGVNISCIGCGGVGGVIPGPIKASISSWGDLVQGGCGLQVRLSPAAAGK